MSLGTTLRQRLTLAVACTAQVMIVLDIMIVSVALPTLQHELHLSPAGLEWVVSAYALALATLIPMGGALGDHWGRKRIFMGGVVLFTLASVGCAVSDSGGVLIGFRVIQGIGGAVMSSLTLSLIAEAYPPRSRTGPIGLWAAVSGLAVAGGSVVGGVLLSVFPWSSIFWVNVPIGIVTLAVSRIAVAESREPVPRPFDTSGVALSASGLLLLTFGLVDSADASWHSPLVAACVVTGAAVLTIFFGWERRTAFPMVPRELLRTRSFGRACAVYLLAYLAFSGFIYYVTLFFQNVDGWSALRTGLSWLFFCVPYFVVAQLSRWVSRRVSVAAAVGWGCLIAAVGMAGMSQLTTATPFAWPAACYVLVGVGFALMVPAGSAAAMAEVPEGSSGIGSGLFSACRQIGTATGLAVLGSVGAGVTLAHWHHQAASFPAAGRRQAARAGADVAGGQVHAAAAQVTGHALDPAVTSFLQGFEVALLLAAVIIAVGGIVGLRGLRHLRGSGGRVRQKRPSTDRADRVRMLDVPGRALSFGSAAQAYERFRPGYPAELVDIVMTYAGQPVRTALEIGAGTGKATRLFAQRGVAVTSTEPDGAMLAELRKHVPASVKTVQAAFEDLRPGERYALVYAAAALHWTSPEGRWSRMAALLEPGGVFASFGGPVRLADPAVAEAVRAARAPFLESEQVTSPDGTPPERAMQWPGTELQRSHWFTDVQQFVIDRRLTMSAGDYAGHLSTVSAYLQLPTPVLEQVISRVQQVLPESVEIVADITVHLGRRRCDQ